MSSFEKVRVDLINGSAEEFTSRTSFVVAMDTADEWDEAEVMNALFRHLEKLFPARKVSVGHRTFPVLRRDNQDSWIKDEYVQKYLNGCLCNPAPNVGQSHFIGCRYQSVMDKD